MLGIYDKCTLMCSLFKNFVVQYNTEITLWHYLWHTFGTTYHSTSQQCTQYTATPISVPRTTRPARHG